MTSRNAQVLGSIPTLGYPEARRKVGFIIHADTGNRTVASAEQSEEERARMPMSPEGDTPIKFHSANGAKRRTRAPASEGSPEG